MTDQAKLYRVILGFVAVPLVAGLLWSIPSGDVFPLVYTTVGGYPSILIFGVPAFLLVRRFSQVNFWSCLIGGGVCGAAAGLSFGLSIDTQYLASPIFMFGAFGFFGGFTFWLIAVEQW